MRSRPVVCILEVALLLMLSFDAAAQPFVDPYPPADALLLVQTELDHLKGHDRRISLEVEKASPRDVLKRIGKVARITVEVKVDLAGERLLTARFEDATVKEVLEWFAETVGVVYRVEREEKLLVLPVPRAKDDAQG